MVAEDFSTPKVVAGGKFIEFTFFERHQKVFVVPEAIASVREASDTKGSMVELTSGNSLLVEQEVIQIVAVLALRSRKKADGEFAHFPTFDDDPTAVKLEGDAP